MARIEDRTPEDSGDKDMREVFAPLLGVEPEQIDKAVLVAYVPSMGGLAFGGHMSEYEIAQFLAKALDVLAEAIADQIVDDIFGGIVGRELNGEGLMATAASHDHDDDDQGEHFPQASVDPLLN